MNKEQEEEIFNFINKHGVESRINQSDTLKFLKDLVISLSVESDLNDIRYESKKNFDISQYIEEVLGYNLEIEKAEEYIHLIKEDMKQEKKEKRRQLVRTFFNQY